MSAGKFISLLSYFLLQVIVDQWNTGKLSYYKDRMLIYRMLEVNNIYQKNNCHIWNLETKEIIVSHCSRADSDLYGLKKGKSEAIIVNEFGLIIQ